MNVLVAGIGNIFLGDDAFGVEVVKHIDTASLPAEVQDSVKVADFGIRGVHLAYELLDGYDALVLIDAMPLDEPPGTVVTFEPDVDAIDPAGGRRALDEPGSRSRSAGRHGWPCAPRRCRGLSAVDGR